MLSEFLNVPRFNIDQRLQLARDICDSPRAHDLLRRAAQAVADAMAQVRIAPQGHLTFAKGSLSTGYALYARCVLKDAEVDELVLLQVTFSMHTDGVLRGRCELEVALFEGAAVDNGDPGKPLGRRLARLSAFATPVDLNFGEADQDVARLWQMVTRLGYGERFSWEPGLASAVAAAFCDQVAP